MCENIIHCCIQCQQPGFIAAHTHRWLQISL
jgi:ribosomal protein S27AE